MSLRGEAPTLAIVTGAGGGGIGTSIAERFLQRGYALVCVERTEVGANIVRSVLGASPTIIIGDVGSESTLGSVRTLVEANPGQRIVAVHNAARGASWKPISEVSLDEFKQDLDDILVGAFLLCRTVVPAFHQQQGGRLVFISSSAALRGARRRGPSYAAAKAGLHGLAKQMAVDIAEFNATANVVVPYQTLTPRVLRGNRRTVEEINANARIAVPLGRVARPQEVAAVVDFLCSHDASYVTGQCWEVDGGQSLAPANK